MVFSPLGNSFPSSSLMQIQIIWSYVLIFVLACVLYSFLYIEYQQNTKLIENNQVFIQQAIAKTLKSNQRAKLEKLPESANHFSANWKSIKPVFWVSENGRLVYPFRFLGKKSQTKSPLWQHYTASYATTQTHKLSIAAQKRVLLIHKIKSLRRQGHSPLLEQAIQDYLSMLQHFRLSPLEEVVSGLWLLKTDHGQQWSSDFIKLFVTEGGDGIKPLLDYLFINSAGFTEADAREALQQIYALYRAHKLDVTWLKSNEQKFWQTGPAQGISRLAEYSLMNNAVLLHKNGQLSYVLPINLNQEVALVAAELKRRGLLDGDDEIQLVDGFNYVDLAAVQFVINRERWNKQRFNQQLFFTVKVIVLTASLFILFHLLKTLSLRYQNYRAYLDLRQNFLNMVNHELKTPLASVRIMVEALEKRVRQNMDVKDYPERIVNQLDQLWLMVDNLLSLNRIKSGEYLVDYTSVNIHELVESLASRLVGSSQHELSIKPPVLPEAD